MRLNLNRDQKSVLIFIVGVLLIKGINCFPERGWNVYGRLVIVLCVLGGIFYICYQDRKKRKSCEKCTKDKGKQGQKTKE